MILIACLRVFLPKARIIVFGKVFSRDVLCFVFLTIFLEEYEEIIAKKTNVIVAGNIINAIVESEFVDFIDPQFHFELITNDNDDNKFVDCAIAANATYIVSEDKHFDVLKEISFPKLLVIGLKDFLQTLMKAE